MRYLNKATDIINYVLSKNLTLYETKIFVSWMTDKENYRTSVTNLAHRLNIQIPHVSRALKNLTEKGILVKNDSVYELNPELIEKVTSMGNNFVNVTYTGNKLPPEVMPVEVKELPPEVKELPIQVNAENINVTSTGSKSYPYRHTNQEPRINQENLNDQTNQNQELIETLILKLRDDFSINKNFNNRKPCLLTFFTALKQNNYSLTDLSPSDESKIKEIFVPRKKPASMNKDKYESWDNQIEQEIEDAKAYIYTSDIKSPKVKMPNEAKLRLKQLESMGFKIVDDLPVSPEMEEKFKNWETYKLE
jgi:DNA-binding Lrp family transcriptional regulator